jgi:hypothetical protein
MMIYAAVHESAIGTKCECRLVPLTTAIEGSADAPSNVPIRSAHSPSESSARVCCDAQQLCLMW